MVRSMTAYAMVEENTDIGLVQVEMRSVNARFLDLNIRMPEAFRPFENDVRAVVGKHISRGKVDLFIRHTPDVSGASALRINHSLLEQLSTLYARVGPQFPEMGLSFTDLLGFPGVLETDAVDEQAAKSCLMHAMRSALQLFLNHREREGAHLSDSMLERMGEVEHLVGAMKARLPVIVEGVTQRMRDRLSDLPQPVDEGRFEQELVLALTKMDVAEELDRLVAHVAELRHNLEKGGVIGRRLDFLLQEFNREANTLASKSVDTQGTQIAVDLKVLIEQVREQVQNIE